MKKILRFNSTMTTAYAIAILTGVMFITQEYIPAMLGIVALELHLLNVNIRSVKIAIDKMK